MNTISLQFKIKYKKNKMIKYNTILSESDYTNLKRHLLINKYLNLSVLILGRWYSCPLFLSTLYINPIQANIQCIIGYNFLCQIKNESLLLTCHQLMKLMLEDV